MAEDCDEENTSIAQKHLAESMYPDMEDITDIFDVNGEGFDVTLSMRDGELSWTTVNPNKAKGN